jgi:HAD superfamily hydrolase (TIGR01509 family)
VPSEPPVAVLFDLDGVIVDSRAFHVEAWVALTRAHGIDAPPGYFTQTFGMRNDAILGGLLAGAATERIAALAGEKEATFRELARGRLEPLPGARELVGFLREQAVPRAVVTSTPLANLRMILETLGLDGAFDALVSEKDVAKGKPDPQGFLLGAQRLQAEPAVCVVIEDAPAGLAAAKAGGMRAIGVTTTHPAPDLGDAHLVVDSLTEEAVRTFIFG